MSKFLIVDASHLFWRSRYSVRGTPEEQAGLCLSILFSSVGKLWRTQKADHIIFAFDGRSWRKDIYPPYKANRTEKRSKMTLAEKEQDNLFFDRFNAFKEFVENKTNCTVLYNSTLEADDLISGFITEHPNDHHIIVSGDKDFEQLLSPSVTMYDGLTDNTITINGIFDYKGNPVMDKKTGSPKVAPDPEWSVFEKAMRGCTTDNVFSAYPGVRTKSTKKKIGLLEAYADRHKKGFDWSSLVMTRWVDHHGEEHRVLDDYNRNVTLVDLRKQPENIKQLISVTIQEECSSKNIPNIGLHFLKFCGKYELVKLSDQAKYFSELLAVSYPKSNDKN